MLQETSSSVTILVYEENKGPKCFQLSKKKVKWLLYLCLTFLSLTLVSSLAMLLVFKYSTFTSEQETPKIVEDLIKQKLVVQQNLDQLSEKYENILQRLNTPPAPIDSQLKQRLILPLFAPVTGAQNLESKNLISLQDPSILVEANQLQVQFKLANPAMNESVLLRGYLFVVVQNQGQINIYPSTATDTSLQESMLNYQAGEKFSISRFKPLNLNFPLAGPRSSSTVTIIVFSKLGDLLLYKKINSNI